MMKFYFLISICLSVQFLFSQDRVIGQGDADGVTITTSDNAQSTSGENTLNSQGFFPNLNAASRFLSQASFGPNYENIEALASLGFEQWIDDQFNIPRPFDLTGRVHLQKTIKNNALNTPDEPALGYYWNNAWWHYNITSSDVLRQRIAFALSEFFVISEKSDFGFNAFALASYYDILLRHAFGNYRDLLEDVTYHAAMGQYLTYLHNPKADTLYNLDWNVYPPDTLSVQYFFPDENYAREVMQLFSIGLYELEIDGSCTKDENGNTIPTYNNQTIAEFAKVFTGFGWGGSVGFYEGPEDQDETYLNPMKMFDEFHQGGAKHLLNNFVTPNRNPADGDADIQDALDNIFNHNNIGPFLGKFMIQRLVTSNPSPGYIERVAKAFNGESSYGTTRGDMKAMIKSILLDDEARDCASGDVDTYGMLREPFVRYVQLGKAFDLTSPSGEHRNTMYNIEYFIHQKPLSSPSVFNFFQSDYQPIGSIENADLVAPEFQITNSQTIAGYRNAVMSWFFGYTQYADTWGIYEGEPNIESHISSFDFEDELLLTKDEYIPHLIERLNLILAHGKLQEETEDIIINAVRSFEYVERNCLKDCEPYCDPNDTTCDNIPDPDCIMYCERDIYNSKLDRVKLAIYLIMTSPDYLINR